MQITAYEKPGHHELAARWRELMDDPGTPERCELDEFGAMHVNPPPSFKHQRIVAALTRELERALGGEPGSYAVSTAAGVKFPDICWAPSFDELARDGGADPLMRMPPLVIEVVSPGDWRKDISEKIAAYLAAGVEEVILVETSARIRYFTTAGEQSDSKFGLHPTLPAGTYPI